jgi:hypothetical protein
MFPKLATKGCRKIRAAPLLRCGCRSSSFPMR